MKSKPTQQDLENKLKSISAAEHENSERLKAEGDVRQQARNLSILLSASQMLAQAPPDSNEIALIMARQFVDVLGLPEVSVSLFDPRDNSLLYLIDYYALEDVGENDENWTGKKVPIANYPMAVHAMNILKPLIVQVSDPKLDPKAKASMQATGVATTALFPMVVKNRFIGFLEMETWGKEYHYSDQELDMAMALTNQTAVALENAKLYETAQHEILERKQTEEELRTSEERYRLMTENAADVIWTMDMNFRFTYISPSISQLRGYTVEEAMAQTIDETIRPDSLTKIMSLVDHKLSLIAAGDDKGWSPVIFEAEQNCKDGKTVWSHNSARFLQSSDGKPQSMIGVTRNITERRLAEDALKKSEKRYRTLFEKSTDAIFVVERGTGRYLDANEAALHLSGRRLSELTQLSTRDITPDGYRERLALYSESDSAKMLGNVTYVQPDGTERITKLTTVPLDARAIIGIARDITDELAMEDQLRQSQKMEAIGTLAGGIAHDFNNILSAILGYSELALADLPTESSLRNKLEAIHSSGERARDLVTQILAFSRKEELVRSPVELHMIVKDALKLLRPAIPTTIDIQTHITSKSKILGDPTRIHQIIMNLCTNAYQAMLEKGGILNISMSDIELDGSAARRLHIPDGSYGELTISDSGSGISSENIDRIFDPYFTTKEKGKGTGLGLAAVHGIVKSHGGKILLESEIGKGTKFTVYLPLLSVIKTVSEKQDAFQIVGGNERILLVDDEVSILRVEEEVLQRLGYRTTAKENPLEALELFKQQSERFDLVITDMTMPSMSGDKLAENLIKIQADIPIILCTGFSEIMTKEKAETTGVKGFLMKPATIKDLSTLVRKVLDNQEDR